jgi:proteasome lid subunit RPN8/RPN11
MIRISRKLLEEMIEHLRGERPNEGCGILAGRDGKVERIYRITNIEESPYSYLADPREQLRAMKEMRELGLEMVGIYHSHVSTQPYPSQRDIELAFYPDVSYLIVSLQNPDAPQVRAFRIEDGRVTEEEMVIGGDENDDLDTP